MSSLSQPTPQPTPQPTKEDKYTAAFDVALSLPPVEEFLNSEYFLAYCLEVARTGNCPF